MQIQIKKGNKLGIILKDFKDNIDRPLSAILSLNTIAHTAGAIGVGQEATKIWSDANPLITGLVVPVGMTVAILIFSEIIPKTLGATNWKSFAPFTIRSLNFLIKVLAPIIWLCQSITVFFNSDKKKSIFSRHDFLALAEIGSQEGALDPTEITFIHNLMHFKKYQAQQVMTPRTVIETAPKNMKAREFYDLQEDLVFSRIPLRESDTSENIVGYVLKDDVLEHLIDDEGDKELGEFMREIFTISEDYSIFHLFNDFIEKREHIALVVDEFGGISGIVTMEDVIETLLGAEIVDETDKIVDMQDMAKKRWKNRYKRSTRQK
tara:strand:- start:22481 stop:23443 length:963 start_codon:yes stop_codon:yes gene_type:complete